MALFQTSFGSRLFYEEFGDAAAPPLMLIHGSTMTGRLDYMECSNMVQRFSTRYRVILPDCEGHGRSGARWRDTPVEGTRLIYSFSDMARGLAELLNGIGASPAVVAGHSNGGNVALHMAKEQTRHVRAAVLLAANGYIDAHLPARVPRGMNPDRVARESPDWRDEMIRYHDVHQGDGFWRDLLLATITETISTPNWTRGDLADLRVPCLCIQGENDAVNAPGRHAQVLSEWLPVSELWVPEGIGHSVHHELPDEFERRVNAFVDAHAAG
jgi:pimeloyl-ACP methyl ester carboxylesterase